MEGERKSVFERLGTIRPKQSGSNLAPPNSNRGGQHELKREDLRHRVVHLTKRRSHHPSPGQYHQHSSGLKRSKSNLPEPPLPSKQTKLRRRKKKPKIIDEENLDEGEIVDDDDEDEYEEYEDDEEEEGEIDFKKHTGPRHSNLPEGDNISLSSLSDNIDEENRHFQKNGQASGTTKQPVVKVKQEETEDTVIIKIKEEAFDDDDKRPIQVGSDYSDWSDGDDDELLELENNDQQGGDKGATMDVIKSKPVVVVKEEIEDSIDVVTSKNIEDLEAISDDDLDPMSDDFYDKSGSQTDMDDLLIKSDSLSQFPDGTTSASTASTLNNDVCGDIKVLDILEIDWKSLITKKARAEVENSEEASSEAKDSHAEYRHRNSTISLLNRIGFSHDLAGPSLTAFIESQLSDKLKDQYVPMFDSLPALHCYYREKRELREGFFKTAQEQSSTGAPLSPLNGAKIEAFGRMAL